MTRNSRRRFLQAAGAATAGWWLLADSRSARTAQANERSVGREPGRGPHQRSQFGLRVATGA